MSSKPNISGVIVGADNTGVGRSQPTKRPKMGTLGYYIAHKEPEPCQHQLALKAYFEANYDRLYGIILPIVTNNIRTIRKANNGFSQPDDIAQAALSKAYLVCHVELANTSANSRPYTLEETEEHILSKTYASIYNPIIDPDAEVPEYTIEDVDYCKEQMHLNSILIDVDDQYPDEDDTTMWNTTTSAHKFHESTWKQTIYQTNQIAVGMKGLLDDSEDIELMATCFHVPTGTWKGYNDWQILSINPRLDHYTLGSHKRAVELAYKVAVATINQGE